MLELVWLIPLLPFVGFLILAMVGSRLPQPQVAIIGVGSVGLAALLTILVAVSFLGSLPARPAYGQTLWTWMAVAVIRALTLLLAGGAVRLCSVTSNVSWPIPPSARSAICCWRWA
jgi:NADH-quinone oxidoreductase subunit L